MWKILHFYTIWGQKNYSVANNSDSNNDNNNNKNVHGNKSLIIIHD